MSDRYRDVPIRRYGDGGWRALTDQVVEERLLRVTVTGSVQGEVELLASPWGTEVLVAGALARVWGVLPWQWQFVTPPDRRAHPRRSVAGRDGASEEVVVNVNGEAGVARRRAAVAADTGGATDTVGAVAAGTGGATETVGAVAAGAGAASDTVGAAASAGTGPDRGKASRAAPRGVAFPVWSPREVIAVTDRLTSASSVHRITGGVHLAIYVADQCSVVCEDISRHSAIDRLVGTLLMRRTVPWPGIVALSCRVTADLFDRATQMNAPLVASVSAPTFEAIATAEAAGTTLCGFVREGRLNLYAGAGRVAGSRRV